MESILIIEDEEAIRTGLKYCLESESFHVFLAEDARTGLEILKERNISLILLDVNLPDQDGFSLFPLLKQEKDVPILFLTANDFEVSIVKGLDMGADDYITKPFKTRELISRIHSVLRRTSKNSTSNIITIQDITIDLNQAKVLKKGVDVLLTALEYKILLILVLNPNVVFSREKILADIWDVNEEYVNDNTLTVYIKRIREKIETDPLNPRIILTVRGLGYRVASHD